MTAGQLMLEALTASICAFNIARFRMAWLVALTLWASFLSPPAWALQDLIQHRAVLVDPDGKLTIDQVARQQNFKPVDGPLSRGYTSSVTWLRIEVAPTPLAQVALLIQPTYLDDLRLYSRSPADVEAKAAAESAGQALPHLSEHSTSPTTATWTEQRTGDRTKLSQKPVKSVNPAFLVTPDPEKSTVFYLRLQTTSVSMLHVKALSLIDLTTFDTALHSAVSAYVGVIGILACFAFVCWRITRDPIWALDSLFQVATVGFTVFIMGMGGRYWFAEWPTAADITTSAMSVTHLAMGGLFFWQLFKAYGAPGWTTWIYRTSLMLFPVQLGLIWLADPRSAVALNSNLLLLQTVSGLFIIWFVPIKDRLQRLLMRFVYVSLTAYLLFFILPLLGLAKATEFNLYPALGANLFSGILMQAVLWRRTHLHLKERGALRLKLAASEQYAKYEAARRAEASTFLSMLVHEIKNPLTSIAIASKTLTKILPSVPTAQNGPHPQVLQLENIQNAVQSIDSVLDRCLEADRLERGALLIHPQSIDVAQALTDWVSAEPDALRIVQTFKEPLTAWVDGPLLCLMVRNLISNALKYSPHASRVMLKLTPKTLQADTAQDIRGSTAHEASNQEVPGFSITVANAEGKAGVPDPNRMFEKYYRAPGAQHQTGTGLGLYWVQGVANLLGGHVAYRYEAGEPQPIVFEIWLPLEPTSQTAHCKASEATE